MSGTLFARSLMFCAVGVAVSKLRRADIFSRPLSSMSPSVKILYRNSDCVVVDKPADMAINAWDHERHPVTVATLLEEMIPECVDLSVPNRFRFVHRLDFSTSGVLCIALNKKGAARIQKCFQERLTDKTYIALLIGHLKEERTIDVPIGEDQRASHKMLPDTDSHCIQDTVRHAKTRFTPIQYGTFGNTLVTKVQIKLFTGRRHQIRIHALTMGHPILGDYTYTDDRHWSRMYLHSKRLCIPCRGETIDVESPIDFELDTVLEDCAQPRTDTIDP